jgi:uncharacterized protein (TIGR02596 family)
MLQARHAPLPHRPLSQAAFTMIELIVVIAIIALLITLASLGTTRLIGGARLLEATALLQDQLELAARRASIEDREIELRFYQLPDPASAPLFTQFQFFAYTTPLDPAHPDYVSPGAPSFSASATPLSPPFNLPAGVAFFTPDPHSTLLTDPSRTPDPPQVDLGLDAPVPVRRFLLTPSGSTDLATGTSWTLTLVDARHALTGNTNLPPDFVTLQLDPTTARIRRFRPD